MKLKELRTIIDQLDDSSGKDYEVVLDIDPSGEDEHLVGIGDVYVSKMHKDTIKIEPEIELDTHKVPRRMLIHPVALPIPEVKCPNCRKKVGRNDDYCKHCGQPLYTAGETMESLRREARDIKRRKKLVKMHERSDKRAAKVAKQLRRRKPVKAEDAPKKAQKKLPIPNVFGKKK